MDTKTENIKLNKTIPNYCFIDGQNLETGMKNNNLEIQYEILFEYLKKTYKVTKILYFIKFSKDRTREVFFERLINIGYELVFSSGMGNSRIDGSNKVNIDADLIVAALDLFFSKEKFGLILISGDGDFVPLIRFFERRKLFVKIITSDRDSTSKMLAFDRYTKTKRHLIYIEPDLKKLTKKYHPLAGEWRD